MWNEDGGLDALLAPVTKEEFFVRHFERKPLLIQGRPRRYEGLFDVGELESILTYTRPRPGSGIRAAKSSETLARSQGPFVDPLWSQDDGQSAHLALAWSLHDTGRTITVSNLEHRTRSVAYLCRALCKDFGGHVHANCFLSPPGTQGFKLHYDTYDVLFLQISGRKRWKIYPSAVELPFKQPSAPPKFHESLVDEAHAGKPEEIILEEGDLLYLPRGLPHQGISLDRSSLHLSLTVRAPHWKDLIQHILLGVSQRDVRFRHHLPPKWLEDAGAYESARGTVRALLQTLLEEFSVEEGIDSLARSMLSDLRPLPGRRFSSLAHVKDIGEETFFEVPPGTPCHIGAGPEDMISLYFPGDAVSVDAIAEPLLRFIVSVNRKFQLRELPGDLELGDKIQLARTLVSSGFLMASDGP